MMRVNQRVSKQLDLLKYDHDLCDAAVLAFGGSIYLDKKPDFILKSIEKIKSQEGWIFAARF